MLDLREVSDRREDEFLEFKKIVDPKHIRPDLCAFLMLSEILPSKFGHDMVCSAEHDQIWLDVDCEELAKVIAEAQFVDLMRCGVMYDDDTESLSMFV